MITSGDVQSREKRVRMLNPNGQKHMNKTGMTSKQRHNGVENSNIRMKTTKYGKRLILQSINDEPKKSLAPSDY